jgi:hypothetical protein
VAKSHARDRGACGGVVLVRPDSTPGIRVVDGEQLPSPFPGLAEPSWISADGKTVYLPTSCDRCTNYAPAEPSRISADGKTVYLPTSSEPLAELRLALPVFRGAGGAGEHRHGDQAGRAGGQVLELRLHPARRRRVRQQDRRHRRGCGYPGRRRCPRKKVASSGGAWHIICAEWSSLLACAS